MFDKLSEFANKAIDAGTGLGKSAIDISSDLASRVTETGKEKVREAQAKVNEYTSAVDKLDEIRAEIAAHLRNTNSDDNYLIGKHDLAYDINEILNRK